MLYAIEHTEDMSSTGTVHLTSFGDCAGTPVADIKLGDTLVFGFGVTRVVVDIEEASAKFLFVTTEAKGERCTRKMRKDRLAVVR